MARKRKPEVLLEDAFRMMKAAILLKQVESKIPYTDQWRISYFERRKTNNFQIISDYTDLAHLFMITKPYTGLTKEASLKLATNLHEIRKFRKENKKRMEKVTGFFYPEPNGQKKDIWHTDHTSKGRLFPLPIEKYQEFAKRIWERNGGPKFHKKKIDGIKMGIPVTKRDGRYGYYNCVLERYIGVMQERVENSAFGLICHVYN